MTKLSSFLACLGLIGKPKVGLGEKLVLYMCNSLLYMCGARVWVYTAEILQSIL